jgi:hypothetical protein
VANRKEYLERLKLAVEQLHNCSARYCTTIPVHEKFKGQTVWQGEVEVFDLTGHPKAKRAYGWSHREGKDDSGERFVAVLELPPVESAETAVRASIMADGKSGYSK